MNIRIKQRNPWEKRVIMSAVTRKDVAKCSGVSLTIVSQVLNNTPYARIKQETREKVQRVARELGYIQNVLGQALVGKRIYHIGVALTCNDTVGDLHFQEIVRGIRAVAEAESYYVLFCPITSRTDENIAEKLANLVKSKRVDGLIINKEDILTTEIGKLAAEDLPFVLLNSVLPYERPELGPVRSIVFDHSDGMRKTVRYLLGLGHRRIGLINSEHGTFPENYHRTSDNRRLEGYMKELETEGLPYCQELIGCGDFSRKEDVRHTLETFLQLSLPPTAIVTADDLIAIEVMRLLKEWGKKIPEDISVVGCDNSYICEHLTPSLTSLDLPLNEMGRQAAIALLDEFNGKRHTQLPITMLPTHLKIRNSCCSPY